MQSEGHCLSEVLPGAASSCPLGGDHAAQNPPSVHRHSTPTLLLHVFVHPVPNCLVVTGLSERDTCGTPCSHTRPPCLTHARCASPPCLIPVPQGAHCLHLVSPRCQPNVSTVPNGALGQWEHVRICVCKRLCPFIGRIVDIACLDGDRQHSSARCDTTATTDKRADVLCLLYRYVYSPGRLTVVLPPTAGTTRPPLCRRALSATHGWPPWSLSWAQTPQLSPGEWVEVRGLAGQEDGRAEMEQKDRCGNRWTDNGSGTSMHGKVCSGCVLGADGVRGRTHAPTVCRTQACQPLHG